MTSLEQVREMVFSLSAEEQVQLGEELLARHSESSDEDSREIDQVLLSRLKGPFVRFETAEEHDAYIEDFEEQLFSRDSKANG